MGLFAGALAQGQDSPRATPDSPSGAEGGEKQAIKRFANDERELWTSPARVKSHDAPWLLLLGGATAGLFAADHAIMERNDLSPANVRRSGEFSNYGVGALVGAGAGLYLWGKIKGDDHKTETGLLSGEAAINALAVTSILQEAFGRERPAVDAARGRFFSGGTSFPSDHSTVAWSIAGMIAHEYPGPLTKIFSYGLAGAVSLSRLGANAHFPSDVLVGGALGYMVAREMYHEHHSSDLGGAAWGNPSAEPSGDEGGGRFQGTQNLASPYVPLDSWVYPAMERLGALGYLHSEFLGMRPWTRRECARLVEEAGGIFQEQEEDSQKKSKGTEARQIYHALEREFSRELAPPESEKARSLQVESAYTRMLGISGEPLNDSYHFGQTLINDFGRPYAEGFDPISGFSGWGSWGRFAIYTRAEYQHAPSAPGYSQNVQNLIAQIDLTPAQPALPTLTINQFRLLDTYALTKLGDWDFSFGKESLWWGPNVGGSLLLSDNAEPIYMFRVARDRPFTLPGILQGLGAVKVDAFMGKLSGNQFPPRPLFHGEKLSLKPTENLEISFSRTGEFGGVGRPLTLGAIFNTYFAPKSSFDYGASDNPGQRNGGFDLSYRIPGVRNWLTVYTTLMSRDDVTPLFAFFPIRALMSTGLYVPQVPHLRRLDFRAEGVTTDPRNGGNKIGHFAYYELFYRDDYTNKNNLMGDWIGRVGTGYQCWSTYWFHPRTSIQFGYRHAQVASTFIPHGGTLNDGSVSFNYQLGRALTFSTFVQYENWLIPVLASNAKNNVTTSLQVTFWPRWDLSK
jgi:hypothetical protein